MRYAALLVGCLFFAGCVSTPRYVPMTRYVLQPPVETSQAETLPLRLAVRPLEAARPYRLQVLYLEQGTTLTAYPNAEWAELPAETLTRAFVDALRASGRFQDVGLVFDVGVPDFLVLGKIRRFEEVRTGASTQVLCEVSFELRAASDRRVVWVETLSATEPVATPNDPAASVQALGRAAGRVISEAVQHMVALKLSTSEAR